MGVIENFIYFIISCIISFVIIGLYNFRKIGVEKNWKISFALATIITATFFFCLSKVLQFIYMNIFFK